MSFKSDLKPEIKKTNPIELTDDDGSYEYHFSDQVHGVQFRVISPHPTPKIRQHWLDFRSRQKGPAVFIFPRFVDKYYPKSRMELQCSDNGQSYQELYLLTKASNIKQIDLSSCDSEDKKDTYLALYGDIQRLSAEPISLRRKVNIPKNLTGSDKQGTVLSKELSFHYNLHQTSRRKIKAILKVNKSEDRPYLLRFIDQSGAILLSKNVSKKQQDSGSSELDISVRRSSKNQWLRIEVLEERAQRFERILTTPFIKI